MLQRYSFLWLSGTLAHCIQCVSRALLSPYEWDRWQIRTMSGSGFINDSLINMLLGTRSRPVSQLCQFIWFRISVVIGHCSTVQNSTVQYSTVQCSTVQYSTVDRNWALIIFRLSQKRISILFKLSSLDTCTFLFTFDIKYQDFGGTKTFSSPARSKSCAQVSVYQHDDQQRTFNYGDNALTALQVILNHFHLFCCFV